MKSITVNADSRSECGKKSTNSLRAKGNVPCVMYGGEKILHFHAHENVFRPLIYTPDVYIINLVIDGTSHTAVMKEVQFHPVTDKPLHIDFIQVSPDKPVIIELPVRITGDSVGVKAGGKLRIKRRKLRVKGLLEHLPDYLTLNISKLAIGHAIRVGDIRLDNLEILDNKRAQVISVDVSRVAVKSEEEESVEGEEEGTAEEGGEETAATQNE